MSRESSNQEIVRAATQRPRSRKVDSRNSSSTRKRMVTIAGLSHRVEFKL